MGRVFGYLASTDRSTATVVGTLMENQQSIRMVCGPRGCVPYIPASAVGQFDLGGQKGAIWATAISASTVCVVLFAIGLIWIGWRAKRSLAAKVSVVDQSQIRPLLQSVPPNAAQDVPPPPISSAPAPQISAGI